MPFPISSGSTRSKKADSGSYRLLRGRIPPPSSRTLTPAELTEKKTQSVLGALVERAEPLADDVAVAVRAYAGSQGPAGAEEFFKTMGRRGWGVLTKVGNFFDRVERSWVTPIAGLSGLGGSIREKVGSIPDEEGMPRVAELMRAGWRQDPGSLKIGDVVIPDEIASKEVPVLHRLFGLRLGHFRIIPDIVLDPINLLGGPTGGLVAVAGKTRRLTKAGEGLAFKVARHAEETATEAFVRKVGTDRGLREVIQKGLIFPGAHKGTVMEQVIADAHAHIQREASWRTQRVMERLIARDPGLIRKPGIYVAGRILVVPRDALASPFRRIWAATPNRSHISTWAGEALDRGSKVFSEIGLSAQKLAPWMSQTMTEARVIRREQRGHAARWLAKSFKDVPEADKTVIGRFLLERRVHGPDAIKKSADYSRINRQYGPLIDEIDDLMAYLHASESRMGVEIGYDFNYFPVRYLMGKKEWSEIEDAVAILEAGRRETGAVATKVTTRDALGLGNAKYRHDREYPSVEAALNHWKELRVSFADDALAHPEKYVEFNAERILARRLAEHAKFAGDRHEILTIHRRIGRNPGELAERWLRTAFPEATSTLDQWPNAFEAPYFTRQLAAALRPVPATARELMKSAGARTIREPTGITPAALATRIWDELDKTPGVEPMRLALMDALDHISAHAEFYDIARLRQMFGSAPDFPEAARKALQNGADDALAEIAAQPGGGTILASLVGDADELRGALRRSLGRAQETMQADLALRGISRGLTREPKRLRNPATFKAMQDRVAMLQDRERALFLEASTRTIGSDAELVDFWNLHGKWIASQKAVDVEAVRQAMRVRRGRLVRHFQEDYVPLSGMSVNKELNELYVPKTIRNELLRLHEGGQPLPMHYSKVLRALDWVINRQKGAVTVLWPAFNVRNAISDMSTAWTEIGIGLLNPVFAKHAFSIVAGRDGSLRVGGHLVPYAEIRREMRALHVISHADEQLEIIAHDGYPLKPLWSVVDRVTRPETWTPPGGKIIGKDFKLSASELSATRENTSRAYLYLYMRSHATAPEIAAARVNKLHVDYNALSPTMRNWMRRVFLFPTWNVRNVGIQVHHLKEHPGRLFAQVKATSADYGPDEAFLPDYQRGDLKVGIRFNDLGKMSFLTGIDLPFASAIDVAWPGDMKRLFRTWVAQTNPAHAILDAYVWKRDPFSGRDLSEGQRQSLDGMGKVIGMAPKFVRDWMDYLEEKDPDGTTKRSVNAAKYHIFVKASVLSRMASSVERYSRYLKEEGPEFHLALTDFLGGIRIEDFDLTSRQQEIMRSNLKMLEREALKVGAEYEFSLTAPTKRTLVDGD